MGWLKYSGFWFNFVLNPYHWIFDVDMGGLSFGSLVYDDEETEWFWLHMLIGPFNFRLVIDDGKHENEWLSDEDS